MAIIELVAGTLYLVGTPIGNMGDMTDRARETLAAVDVIAAEDTRRTGTLLKRLGIEGGRLVSFFEENESARIPQVIEFLRAGRDVAVVTDAGMPGLSDPGYRLVAACAENGINVDVVPGPSAAVAALVISGLPTDRFVFEGFLPRSGRSRRERLTGLAGEGRTIVIFESPRRVAATVADLIEALGDRRAVLARELTKLHQEIVRGRLADLSGHLASQEPKGEIVLVVEGATRDRSPDLPGAVNIAAGFVASGSRKRDAARQAAKLTGVPARQIYDALVAGPTEG